MKRPERYKGDSGTELIYEADEEIFGQYQYDEEVVEKMLRHYSYLNAGLTLMFNGKKFRSKNGLLDLLKENLGEEELIYPVIHIMDNDIEVAFTHTNQNGEDYYSFVNGQYTTQGGTHLNAFRESIVKAVRDYSKKNLEAPDVRQGLWRRSVCG